MNARLIATLFILSAALLASCKSDKACSVDDDCFRGELCIDGSCGSQLNVSEGDADLVLDGGGDAGGDAAINNDPNGTPNVNPGDAGPAEDATSGDSGPGPDMPSSDAGADADADPNQQACIIDPFGNVCEDDDFEPNENLMTFAPLLFDNQSWCMGTNLQATQTSDKLQLCAGNDLDVFRLMIDNRTPNNCIPGQHTWRIEVRFDEPCDDAVVAIEPFFFDVFQESRCVDDPDFRCMWSPDGLTYTIEFVRDADQLMDINLLVAPADARDDVQVAYDVVMTIVQ